LQADPTVRRDAMTVFVNRNRPFVKPRSVDKFFGQTFRQRCRFLWTKGVRGL